MRPINSQDQELARFFTDAEHLLNLFRKWVVQPVLPKRLLIIHGIGGVGKTSLLRMFRLHCKSARIPVALISGEEVQTVSEILHGWTTDLKADGIRLKTFSKIFKRYRAIQAQIDERLQKKQAEERTAEALAQSAAKTLLEAAGSTIPGVGPAVSKLGSVGIELLWNWLRGFLSNPDVELFLNPAEKLTTAFVSDIAHIASQNRIVIMLDTYEQLSALDYWLCDLVQRLHPNVFLVIAGRTMPNWDHQWAEWLTQSHIEELKPMTEENVRTLIYRYYRAIGEGEPNPEQVEAIIAFARGLPMAVTSAVRLWVGFQAKDFQAVKARVVDDLVDRLIAGIPREMIPVLEAAAVVRWFNQPILRALTGLSDVRGAYNELRRFPFTRSRAEGLMIHDVIREVIEERLRTQDPEWHRELHERASAYFENQMMHKWSLPTATQWVYHKLVVDEKQGMVLLRALFEEGIRVYNLEICEAILNEAEGFNFRYPENQIALEHMKAFLLLEPIRITLLPGKR